MTSFGITDPRTKNSGSGSSIRPLYDRRQRQEENQQRRAQGGVGPLEPPRGPFVHATDACVDAAERFDANCECENANANQQQPGPSQASATHVIVKCQSTIDSSETMDETVQNGLIVLQVICDRRRATTETTTTPGVCLYQHYRQSSHDRTEYARCSVTVGEEGNECSSCVKKANLCQNGSEEGFEIGSCPGMKERQMTLCFDSAQSKLQFHSGGGSSSSSVDDDGEESSSSSFWKKVTTKLPEDKFLMIIGAGVGLLLIMAIVYRRRRRRRGMLGLQSGATGGRRGRRSRTTRTVATENSYRDREHDDNNDNDDEEEITFKDEDRPRREVLELSRPY